MGLLLKPGSDPPIVTPYCQRCDMPVEEYCMDVVREGFEDRIGIHAKCCGYESSTRIALSVYLRLMREPYSKLYVIVRKGGQAGVREPLRRTFQGIHG